MSAPGTGPRVELSQIFTLPPSEQLPGKGTDAAKQVSDTAPPESASSKYDNPYSLWRGYKTAAGMANRAFSKISFKMRGQRHKGMALKLISAYTCYQQQPAITTGAPKPSLADYQPKQINLSDPVSYQLAAALDLAGICRLRHDSKSHVPKLEDQRIELTEELIKHTDKLANMSPQRMAYEYLARGRKLPRHYLHTVLLPHYRQRLMHEAGLNETQARKQLHKLTEEHGLLTSKDIDLEPLMEIRNHIDLMAARAGYKLPPSVAVKPAAQPPEKVKTVTAGHMLSHGSSTRQAVRDHLVQLLHADGVTRERARVLVADTLGTKTSDYETRINAKAYLSACHALGLKSAENPRLVRGFLHVVDKMESGAANVPPDEARKLLTSAGINPDSEFSVEDGKTALPAVIARPQLEPPTEKMLHRCNADDLDLIKARVERPFVIRVTKTMATRMMRWLGRNKRIIGVKVASQMAAAVVLGLMSGGIAGATYMATGIGAIAAITGLEYALGWVQVWRHGGKVEKSAKAGGADPTQEAKAPKQRRRFMQSLSYLTAEKTMSDVFNAYLDMKNATKNQQDMSAHSATDTKARIAYRKHQAKMQMCSAILGDEFKNIDELQVQAVSEISHFEKEFEDLFHHKAWKHFELSETMTPKRRQKIFMRAANRVKRKGHINVASENDISWLRQLTDTGNHRQSDDILHQCFNDFKALSPKKNLLAATAARINMLTNNSLSAANNLAKTVGHFILANVKWSGGSLARVGIRWILEGIIPKKLELIPIPNAAMCVYWASSFFGGKTMQVINNYLNRVRIKQIEKSRRDDTGAQKAFDAEYAPLSTEDWRALRREGRAGMRQFPKVLDKIRLEHKKLAGKLDKLLESDKAVTDRKLEKIALLILQRKQLEHELQLLMGGAMGRFCEEVVRGDWEMRQRFDDIEASLSGRV